MLYAKANELIIPVNLQLIRPVLLVLWTTDIVMIAVLNKNHRSLTFKLPSYFLDLNIAYQLMPDKFYCQIW